MFFLDAFLKGLKPQYDDDACDRLNYYYTPMLFVIFSLTLSAKQYVGQPIQCWIPAQFTGLDSFSCQNIQESIVGHRLVNFLHVNPTEVKVKAKQTMKEKSGGQIILKTDGTDLLDGL
ncbi:hypothetical protein COOONC_21954 [Cooperia oncophora]